MVRSSWYLKKNIFILAVLVCVGLVMFGLNIFFQTVSGRMLWWRVEMDTSGFRKIGFSINSLSTSKRETLSAGKEGLILIVDRAVVENHKKYIDDRKYLLSSMYEPMTSPYPEVITNALNCDEEFKPKEFKIDGGIAYSLLASGRLAYGVCLDDLVKYHSVYGLFDCGTKGVFEVKLFNPRDTQEIKKILQSFKCSNP